MSALDRAGGSGGRGVSGGSTRGSVSGVRCTGGGFSANNPNHIPLARIGNVYASVFKQPGPRTREKLIDHIYNMGNAIATNTHRLAQLNELVSDALLEQDAEVSELEHSGRVVQHYIESVYNFSIAHYREMAVSYGNLRSRLDRTDAMLAKMSNLLLPALYRQRAIAERLVDVGKRWEKGVRSLARGLLSPALVNPSLVRDALRRINHKINTSPTLATVRLISDSPGYIYNIGNIAYARLHQHFSVMVQIPLYTVHGEMTLYRIDSYPFPVATDVATLEPVDGETAMGYTKIGGLPDDLALSTPELLTCATSASSVFVCTSGTLLPRQYDKSIACSFAVFLDDHSAVSSTCDIRYTKQVPIGMAKQLSIDDYFLILLGVRMLATGCCRVRSRRFRR